MQTIGYLPEERGLYKKMKVGEQALYLAKLKGMSHSEAIEKLKYWFDKIGDSALVEQKGGRTQQGNGSENSVCSNGNS